MALAVLFSRAACGIAAPLVTVEVHLYFGTVGFHIVGLPETTVKESRDRVRSAIINSQFEFPIRKIIVNLAPADLPKEGGRFDLAIALGILVASAQIPADSIKDLEFSGELALSGDLRKVKGVLPMALAAYRSKRQLVVPYANADEAGLAPHTQTLKANHLLDVCAHLCQQKLLPACLPSSIFTPMPAMPDLSEVRGQFHARRALEIAAAGRHSLLFVGPPGTGKTMLASRLPSILPELSDEHALEVAAIASVSSPGFNSAKWKKIPFRSPHHSSSTAALVGGGRPPKPGEISLAHGGILFLDELPEFSRAALESLREPLESGMITISRASFQMQFPAKFQFIAAMNPCPCGYAGSLNPACRCAPEQIKRYMAKLSGPLLDRIDMQIEVPAIPLEFLTHVANHSAESSEIVRHRVSITQALQMERQQKLNYALTPTELSQWVIMTKAAEAILSKATDKFNLSARIYHRLLKVALTIADLANEKQIAPEHISEALQYRFLDKLKLRHL